MNINNRPKLTIISAVANNNVIGYKNRIPWNIPQDLQHFKNVTSNHTMIMGRNTFESIGLLPNRKSIVITTDKNYKLNNKINNTNNASLIVVNTIKQALSLVKKEDSFIIGGSQIYEQTIDLATNLIISKIDLPKSPKGDTFFPNIDNKKWQIVDTKQLDNFKIIYYDRTVK